MLVPLYDRNPTRHPARVTRWLLWANVLMALFQWLIAGPGFTEAFGFVPLRAQQSLAGELPHALSSIFLHANLSHLVWNMLFLHIFGDNVEDAMGSRRFLVFYLAAGVAACLGQFALDPHSAVPLIGASGAIAGCLAGYMVLYPKAPVVVFNPIILLWLLVPPLITLPAWVPIILWFLTNGLFDLIFPSPGVMDMTAYGAHVAGFLAGLVSVRAFTGNREVHHGEAWAGWNAKPRPAPRRKIFWKKDNKAFWRGDSRDETPRD